MDNQGRTGIAAEDAVTGRREYIVVARRYRPQAFAELVGQEHVARALSAAITSDRVGHAYLFTGARGVGKTSAARILAKCLNCREGLVPVPCNRCDSCLSIAAGSDVDVLEIDGASNRGIEEMRELRHNVAIRPSRSRFKVYIIDEVHMLTREAFNALLKTLEEPPEHVKFIFCTTEAEKIPVTILSRCQRFDFAGIQAASIVDRLQQIVAAEGVEAESEALALLSRRAGGSMRDSQSLLEQLLAVGGKRITVEDVNHLLGTASNERLLRLAGALIERNAAVALADFDAAVAEGVDAGQLLDQLLVYFRDLMIAAVGGSAEMCLSVEPAGFAALVEASGKLGVHTVLAVMQVLEQTIARLRYSTHGRVLAELALVRICQLADLDELPVLIEQLKSGVALPQSAPRVQPALARPAPSRPGLADEGRAPSSAPQRGASLASERGLDSAKKKDEPPRDAAPVEPQPAASVPSAIQASEAPRLWQQALARLEGMVADYASQAEKISLERSADTANFAPNTLVAVFPKKYNFSKQMCEQPDQLQRIEQALAEVAGQPLRVRLAVAEEPEATAAATTAARPMAARDRVRDKAKHPLVSRAIELFDAEPTKVDGPAE